MDCFRSCAARSARAGCIRMGISRGLRTMDRRPCRCNHATSMTAAPVMTSRPPASNMGAGTAAISFAVAGACRSAGAPRTACAPSTADTAKASPESVTARAVVSRRWVVGAFMGQTSVGAMAGPIKARVLPHCGTDYQSVQHRLIVCATMALRVAFPILGVTCSTARPS